MTHANTPPPLDPALDEGISGSNAVLTAAAASLLAACGGGGGGGDAPPAPSPSPSPPPPPAPPPAPLPPTDTEAARFLLQASFAASSDDIATVKAQGYAAWLDTQLARPMQAPTRLEWMTTNGYAVEANINSFTGADNAIWRKLIASSDPVRQRMTLALSEIFVVSMLGLPISWRGLSIAHYVDLLEKHAFGNYRELLQDVTLSLAMGTYLNMQGNRKEDTRTGRVPDENYAREVMQLFSIGLQQLNLDGTVKKGSDGKALESYTQADITQLARVFTGWERDRAAGVAVEQDAGYASRPMRHNSTQYQLGDKTLLGVTIASSKTGPEALNQALDILFNHPNVGPFIGRQLIQRFTQSNPSPAYVARVAAVFNNNGSGVRGDLKATLRAVLLDAEARPSAGAGTGKLREPIQRFVQWARTFGVTSAANRWAIGDTSDPATRLGQSPSRSPSVFNFFRPGYVPPGNELGANGITAPEFQLVNESTVAGYLNFMQSAIQNGFNSGDVVANYTNEIALSTDSTALLNSLNLRLAANALTSAQIADLAVALNSIAVTTDAGKLNRVRAAILLVMAAPNYLVQQ